MNKLISLKNVVLGASVAVASSSAFADVSAEITSAVSSASTNYGAVVAGVITVAALGFGLSFIVGALRK